MCGDFNTPPDYPGYSLLTHGRVQLPEQGKQKDPLSEKVCTTIIMCMKAPLFDDNHTISVVQYCYAIDYAISYLYNH